MTAVKVIKVLLRVIRQIASRREDNETAKIICEALEIILHALDSEFLVGSTPTILSDDDKRDVDGAIKEISGDGV